MRSPLGRLTTAFSHPVPLKSYLARLMIGVVGPLLVFAVFMMILFARQEHSSRRRGIESVARSLALAVDQEVKSSITKLEAMATSEALDTGAVKIFQEAAERLITTQDNWQSVTLSSPQGTALAVAADSGAQVRPISRERLAEVLQTRQPVVTDYPASSQTRGGVSIHVPVVRERTVIYILSAAVAPWVFTDILAQQRIPADWIATLFDSSKVTIARSRDAKKFIGTPVGPPLSQTNVLSGEQFLRGDPAAGDSVYAAVSRSQLTGWFLALTVPAAELNAILYGSIGLVAGGGLLLLLSGLGDVDGSPPSVLTFVGSTDCAKNTTFDAG